MTRLQSGPRLVQIRKAVKVARESGIEINSIKFDLDGSFTVSALKMPDKPDDDVWTKWDAEQKKRK